MYTTPSRPSRGFTLIELLSVIGIIGVLATVILVSLSNARSKGIDASIRQSLGGARSQAEIYYSANGANYYSGVCGTALVNGIKGINEMVTAAARAYGLTSINTTLAGGTGIATCHDTVAGWAAEVPLKLGGFACADSTLYSGTTTASTLSSAANDIACGP